jgi:hypothetical protein
MKKILLAILLLSSIFINAQKLSIKNNEVEMRSSSNSLLYNATYYNIVDSNNNGTIIITIGSTTKIITLATITSFKVNGVTSPITASSVLDSLIKYKKPTNATVSTTTQSDSIFIKELGITLRDSSSVATLKAILKLLKDSSSLTAFNNILKVNKDSSIYTIAKNILQTNKDSSTFFLIKKLTDSLSKNNAISTTHGKEITLLALLNSNAAQELLLTQMLGIFATENTSINNAANIIAAIQQTQVSDNDASIGNANYNLNGSYWGTDYGQHRKDLSWLNNDAPQVADEVPFFTIGGYDFNSGKVKIASFKNNNLLVSLNGESVNVNPFSINNSQFGSSQVGPWSVGVNNFPANSATSTLQTSGNLSLSSIDIKTPSLGQALAANSTPVVLTAIQLSALTPPAAITGYSLEATALSSNAKLTTLDRTTSSAPYSNRLSDGSAFYNALSDIQLRATPIANNITQVNGVAIATGTGASNAQTIRLKSADEDVSAAHIVGQSAQTIIINNILTTTAGIVSSDLLGYNSATTTIISTGTGGTFVFEGSNDNVNFEAINIKRSLLTTGVLINIAITATVSNFTYEYAIKHRYIRCRIATTITGGSIQAFSRYSITPFAPEIVRVANGAAIDLNTNISGTLTGITNAVSINNAVSTSLIEVASTAVTTTTTTGPFTPTGGKSFQVQIPVTVITGTAPTMQINIEQSLDNGTTWKVLYSFPAITAIGTYYSPRLPISGTRLRYVQTVAGTAPSFTRSITRVQSNDDVNLAYQTEINSISTTITTGGTAQVLIAANATRQGFEIQNKSSGDIFFSIGGTASLTVGFKLVAGASYSSPATRVSTKAISIFGGTTGQLIEFIEY